MKGQTVLEAGLSHDASLGSILLTDYLSNPRTECRGRGPEALTPEGKQFQFCWNQKISQSPLLALGPRLRMFEDVSCIMSEANAQTPGIQSRELR